MDEDNLTKQEPEVDDTLGRKPIRKDINEKVSIDNLVNFKNHPFKLYEGQRLQDMVDSIKANGVIIPIVVRPTDDKKYEILSGHNRVAASREAELTRIPAVIKEGLTDDEALLIVTETNLIQRSFADLKHSERAVALSNHYEAMKKKSGYRSDLMKEIETITSDPVGHRSTTRDKLGSQYGLSKTTITRYLSINKLVPELKERLDNDEVAVRTAVSLSYLRNEEQKIVDSLIKDDRKISMEQAEKLKEESAKGKLKKSDILNIIQTSTTNKIKSIKFSDQFFSQVSEYLNDNQFTEEIETVITEALKKHFSK
jgi:ParB family chromosome partitioning protein